MSQIHEVKDRGASAKRPRAQVGRPAILSVPSIVDAAIEIGVGDLTMAKVAERLNVSVTALYRHVINREELVRLASDKEAARSLIPPDVQQDWLEFCMGQAEQTYQFHLNHPYAIRLLADGNFGPSNWVKRKEVTLMPLVRIGVNMPDALMLTNLFRSMALSAAIETMHRQAAAGSREGYDELVDQAMADHLQQAGPDDTPFDGLGPAFVQAHRERDWRAELRMMLEALRGHIGRREDALGSTSEE